MNLNVDIPLKRVRHEVWLCECALCQAEQDRGRAILRRVRRRLFAPLDPSESDDDSTVVIPE